MKKLLYAAPETEVLEFTFEQAVLTGSGSTEGFSEDDGTW